MRYKRTFEYTHASEEYKTTVDTPDACDVKILAEDGECVARENSHMRRISASARSSQPSQTTSSPSVSTVPCPPACSAARACHARPSVHPSMTAAGVRAVAVPQARRAQEGSRTPSTAISVFKKRVFRNHHVCPRSQRHTSDSDVRFGGCGSSLHSAPAVPGQDCVHRPAECGLRAQELRARCACGTQAQAHRLPRLQSSRTLQQ
jgi:hypothetical protein